MENKDFNQEKTPYKFIAYFDIMGFKDFVYRHSHKQVKEIMYELSDIINIIKKGQVPNLKGYNPNLETILFSDSFIMFSQDDSIDALIFFIVYSTLFIAKCLQKAIPVKGALSYGEITVDMKKSIFCGKPLIDAYTLCNSLKYYGAIIDNNLESFINKYKTNERLTVITDEYILKCKVIIEDKKITHKNLNWINIVQHQSSKEDKVIYYQEIIENFYIKVCGEPRKYVDNTLEFINSYSNKIKLQNELTPKI